MSSSLICPHCKHPFELSDVVREELETDFKKRYSAQKEQHLKLLEEENVRKDKELEEAKKNELELLKRQRLVEEREKNLELEKERVLLKEREFVTKKVTDEITEKFRLTEKEYQKQINDLKISMEEVQKKANQGSQQLQGEIQELDLKDRLKTEFPDDIIEDVEKGIKGADLRQIVRSSRGFVCGTILWESKRTKDWSDSWIAKLKTDLLAAKADIPIIVTTAMPKELNTEFGQIDQVWVSLPRHALVLALALRSKLHDLAKQKYFSENQGTKAESVYQYVTSNEFTRHIQSLVEIYHESLQSLAQEKAAFERIWKRREAQAQRFLTSTTGIFGSLQGIAGPALPIVKGLELPDPISSS